tara:strand:+ start:558 stop:788 length:231 start_codon:yes stop_codon:yes gene_type:complete
MMTKDDISPGCLVRFKADRAAAMKPAAYYPRAHKVGVLVAFDHFGRVNPDKGDPLVLWVGEVKPARMAASSLEIVS